MCDAVAAFAGHDAKGYPFVAHATMLSTHDTFHGDIVRSFLGFKRGGVAIGAVQPLGMLFVGEPDIGHGEGVFHNNRILLALHLT